MNEQPILTPEELGKRMEAAKEIIEAGQHKVTGTATIEEDDQPFMKLSEYLKSQGHNRASRRRIRATMRKPPKSKRH